MREWETSETEREREKRAEKRRGALVCEPDTLAVTVNKLTEGKMRKDGEERET